LKRDEEYDLTRFAFQGCFGIHVFNCFQFWLWDRAIKIHRLSYRESTLNKVSALFFTFVNYKHQQYLTWRNEANSFEARWGIRPSNSKPFERNHDWPLWYRGPPSLSICISGMSWHSCVQMFSILTLR
jgi:hypothetical protein